MPSTVYQKGLVPWSPIWFEVFHGRVVLTDPQFRILGLTKRLFQGRKTGRLPVEIEAVAGLDNGCDVATLLQRQDEIVRHAAVGLVVNRQLALELAACSHAEIGSAEKPYDFP